MSTELTKFDQLPFNGLSDFVAAGQLMAKACMFGADTDEKGFIIASTCYQERISFLEFDRTFHIIKGSPSMKADAMLAGIIFLGGNYKIIEKSCDRAAIEISIDGRELSDSFTWEEAKIETYVYEKDGKTLKDNWSTPRRRKQMLWARLISDAVRTIAPQIVKGVYTPEEVEDFTKAGPKPEKEINPEKAASMVPVPDKPIDPAVNVKAINPDEAFELCPIPGPMENKPWHEMEDDILQSALAVKHELMWKGHFDLIQRIIDARKSGAK